MWKKFSKVALACVLAAGCKDASVDKPADKPSDDTTTTGPTRTGKVDLGAGARRRPRVDSDGSGGGGGVAPYDPTAQEGFEDRRRQRIAQFDHDGDGKISDEERKAARHKRAEDMRKRADADGDGKVTIEELSKGSFRRMDPESVDANKDGDVSADEIAAALEQRNRAWGGRRFRDGKFSRGSGAPGGQGSAAPN
jgi:hypothetical protein